MRFHRRLVKIEEKLAPVEQLTKVLLVLSDQDEQEKIEAFLAENPGGPYEIIRVRFIAPPNRTEES